MIGSVYYLKVMKICYVDNPTSWRSYGKVSPVTAYIIAISVSIMMIGLWWGNALFLFTHILALSVSAVGLNYFFIIFFNKAKQGCAPPPLALCARGLWTMSTGRGAQKCSGRIKSRPNQAEH
jgi:hypothetical protein